MKSTQRGVLTPRSLFIVVILLAMLTIPLWWLRGKPDPQVTQSVAEKAREQGKAPGAAAEPASGNNPDAFGMTWGEMQNDKLPNSAVWMGCHGQPREGISQHHAESCNPYKGDASCRLALPILCIQRDGSTVESAELPKADASANTPNDVATAGWAAGSVAGTEPVAGFVIGSLAQAHARCEKELGPGWRMAEFHDGANGQGGWGFIAKRGSRLDTRQRHWVHINDQPGNCWNNKG